MNYVSLHEAFTNMVLNEYTTTSGFTYIGKTKNLLKAEKLIAKLIADRNNSKKDPWTSISRFTKSKDYKELEKCFKDEFGFKEMFINLYSGGLILPPSKEDDSKKAIDLIIISRNAWTPMMPLMIRDATAGMPGLLVKKERFYDEKHQYLCSVSLTSDWFDGLFTPDEIVAVILHEIGHNFDVSISTYTSDFLRYIDIVSFFKEGKLTQALIGLFPNWIIGSIEKIYSTAVNNLPFLATATEFFGRMMNYIRDVTQLFLPVALIKKMGGLLSSPTKVVSAQLKFNAERFADSFATMYGYGPSFMSGFDKYNRRDYLQDKISDHVRPIIIGAKERKEFDKQMKKLNEEKSKLNIFMKNWFWCGSIITSILCFFIDPHPETQTRLKIILDDCKKLSENKDFPAPIRKALKKDYENAKKQYDKYMGLDKNDKQAFIAKISKAFGEKIFDGKMDLRAYVFRCTAIQSGALIPTKKK